MIEYVFWNFDWILLNDHGIGFQTIFGDLRHIIIIRLFKAMKRFVFIKLNIIKINIRS